MANRDLVLSAALLLLPVFLPPDSIAQTGGSVGEKGNTAAALPMSNPGAEELPESRPNPPTIICDGNQLTISTENSTLSSVLEEVHKCTGAKIDIPDSAAKSRLFDRLGPGPAREVLSSLLTNTGFDFVIGLAESDPDKVETILLMARATDTTSAIRAGSSMTQAHRAYNLTHQNDRVSPATTENSDSGFATDHDSSVKDNGSVEPSENTTSNATHAPEADPVPGVVEPGLAAPGNPRSTPGNASLSPAQSTDTNDQITNMEKLFEQRRQMMQNQNPTSPH